MAYQLTILNSVTSAPVAGARAFVVFVGTSQIVTSGPSDASGVLSIDTASLQNVGKTETTVTAAGFVKSVVESQSLPTGNTTIALSLATPPAFEVRVLVEPRIDQTNSSGVAPTAGCKVVFNGTTQVATTVGNDGIGTGTNSFKAGHYTVSIFGQGFDTLTQGVDILQGQADVTFTLIRAQAAVDAVPLTSQVAASQAADIAAPGLEQQAISEAAAMANASMSESDVPYEFVYPNSEDGKYFQAAQARMYIGNHFVDELNLCQWTGAQNRIPIYGYRSNKFDAVGTGRSLVQGQLAINFISEGYMYILLKDFQKKITSSLALPLDGISDSLQTSIKGLYAARAKALAANKPTTYFDALLVTSGKSSPQAAAYISSLLSSGPTSGSSGPHSQTIRYGNAIYLNIPFDIEVKLQGAGRTVTKVLKHCFLGANDFSFAHDGQTLLDSYSFIAREVS